jgi:hypothetical protein
VGRFCYLYPTLFATCDSHKVPISPAHHQQGSTSEKETQNGEQQGIDWRTQGSRLAT